MKIEDPFDNVIEVPVENISIRIKLQKRIEEYNKHHVEEPEECTDYDDGTDHMAKLIRDTIDNEILEQLHHQALLGEEDY